MRIGIHDWNNEVKEIMGLNSLREVINELPHFYDKINSKTKGRYAWEKHK